jgi:hypothetical protein
MQRILFLLCFMITIAASPSFAQDALPQITVKNISGKIIVSWLIDLAKSPKTIDIQRSYDSLKNYITIGSVLNPENRENGYADATPPYNNMYYRVFIAFEGGSYFFSKVARPGKGSFFATELSTGDSIALFHIKPVTYNSSRIHPGKENNIIVHLQDAETKKYSVKFYDEDNKLLFVLNKLHETDLVIDKVNFVHAGWFYFEVFESGKFIEKNKFYIPKDEKIQQASYNEQGKRNRQ